MEYPNIELAQKIIEHIASINQISGTLTTWGLSMLGGSILFIVSTSYNRPSAKFRLAYLLFIPAWIFTSLSIYFGSTIGQRVPASILAKEGTEEKIARLFEISRLANSEYKFQLLFFQTALGIYALWLLIFLIWWVFYKQQSIKTD